VPANGADAGFRALNDDEVRGLGAPGAPAFQRSFDTAPQGRMIERRQERLAIA